MPRRNGSFFGFTVAPTTTAASGMWRVSEAEAYLRENKWPAAPGVPGSPVGITGNNQVSLTWSAPTVGSPPTDYLVQYSSDSGANWTTFSDGASSSTSATVTGLTNGTAYIFRVVAVNELGQGPYGSASAAYTPEAYVASLLLHFDDTNGSTSFIDSSANGLTVTGNGNAEISTTQSKFGGSSLLLDGSSSLTISDSGFMQFGTGDFTVDCWVYVDQDQNTNQYVFDMDANKGVLQILNDYGLVGPIATNWDADGNAGGVTAITSNVWTHLAMVRANGVLYLYINGTLAGSMSDASDYTGTSLTIGEYGGGGYGMYGYIDEFRIVNGTAVWTSNFTPPSSAY